MGCLSMMQVKGRACPDRLHRSWRCSFARGRRGDQLSPQLAPSLLAALGESLRFVLFQAVEPGAIAPRRGVPVRVLPMTLDSESPCLSLFRRV